ncbi:MAG: hypothetical protein AAGI89_08900 [Pseudomonadota bacterium]
MGRLKSALGRVAPELARALGGPLAGAATSAAARALLGREDASEEELAATLERADPQALQELRMASLAFDKALLDAAHESERIAAGDRADARARQVELGDWVPGALGVTVVGGFFCVLAVMLLREVPSGAETEFSIMLGALATMAAAVMNYYFGSSASSREKTRLLSDDRSPAAPRRLL